MDILYASRYSIASKSMNTQTHTVFLGLGSNVGEREVQVARAAYQLGQAEGMRLVALSPLYDSPAMLPDDAPEMWDRPFINAVARYETSLAPQVVLALAQAQERVSGRKDRGKWGPRELDVDVLAYGDLELQSEVLSLPHAGIATREFVLLPWADIAPDWQHPPVAELAAQLSDITARKT